MTYRHEHFILRTLGQSHQAANMTLNPESLLSNLTAHRLTLPITAGKPLAQWYAPITMFFRLPHQHPLPVIAAAAKWMTQGDSFLCAGCEQGLVSVMTNWCFKFDLQFSH